MIVATHHYTMLTTGSAIAAALITARGYVSLPQPEDLIDRGYTKAQAKTAPALGIPLWDVHGQRSGWQIGLAAAAVRKPTVRTWSAPCEP